MKKTALFIFLFFLIGYFTACRHAGNSKTHGRDSISSNSSNDSFELASLVVKVLKWSESDRQIDFNVTKTNSGDSIYSGIDWSTHKKRMADLSKTDFFTDDFLNNYNNIALHIDKELKTNPTKYLEGDIQPWSDDTNDWCKCQDFPDSIWEKLKIVDLISHGDSANFKWSWGDNYYYSVKTKKENGSWRISYLERFDIQKFSW
ncbi:MAG TPA: hypothetical protein VK622_01555 [Puia sp.]|nr:hypothetical protein [Puia sp.]